MIDISVIFNQSIVILEPVKSTLNCTITIFRFQRFVTDIIQIDFLIIQSSKELNEIQISN